LEGAGPGSNPRSPARRGTGSGSEATPLAARFLPYFQGFSPRNGHEQHTLLCTVHLYMCIIGYEERKVNDGSRIFLRFG
jgi:hypothetical protein